MELRWRFRINADVEETERLARSKGLSARPLEGQSRTNEELYPLNQVEIKGWNLTSNVKVIVSPTVTQVYFDIESCGIEELENITVSLGKVERILNEVVVFAEDEAARFSMETEVPVMSIGMLKAQYALKEEVHRAVEGLYELMLKEVSLVPVFLAQGKIGYAISRLDTLSNGLVNMYHELIQRAKEQGFEEAAEWEAQSLQFEVELASARSPADFANLFGKYLDKGSNSRQ